LIKSPDYVNRIEPYVPGKPIEEVERELGIKNSIKLASNENPLGPSPLALRGMRAHLENLHRYPDGGCFRLKEALSKKLGVAASEIIVGNGSNELLDIAARTFLIPGSGAVMARPSFVVYNMAASAVGAVALEIPLKDYRHDLPSMSAAVTPDTRMVFIANPNNPTGTVVSAVEFDRFMTLIPDGVLVVVDEAYFEYVQDGGYADSMKHFRDGRDILILRTFSKIYGLAGLRVGYGVASSSIISQMNKIREPFNVNSLAQAAALGAIADDAHVIKSVDVNARGKEFLYEALSALGVPYVPTEANFIYLHPIKDAPGVSNKLMKLGIIVRPMGGDALRVTIGLPHENEAFANRLKEVFQ
jgi:histidinol-phosphate aminotransferase